MSIIKRVRISLTYKVRVLYAFLKSDQIFSIYGLMKIRFPSSDIRVFEQIFLDQNYFFLVDNFNPKVIIDAGANVGYSAIWFSYKFKEAKILAIEPEKRNFDILKQNVKNWINIEPIKAAVWSNDSQIWIKDTTKKSWSFETSEKQGLNSEAVQGISILTLIEKYKLNQIDILKIDIEGAEAELFNDKSKKWLDWVNCLMIETHDKKIPGVSKIVDKVMIENSFIKFKTKDLSIYYNKKLLVL